MLKAEQLIHLIHRQRNRLKKEEHLLKCCNNNVNLTPSYARPKVSVWYKQNLSLLSVNENLTSSLCCASNSSNLREQVSVNGIVSISVERIMHLGIAPTVVDWSSSFLLKCGSNRQSFHLSIQTLLPIPFCPYPVLASTCLWINSKCSEISVEHTKFTTRPIL
jgi:hypothetical protein